ncbi:hypothetical protein M426DRAFT_108973 [Hypoxylon sp. CI-4A]|nr:hypothetical protein M426DRAFT_108973 [Hypoxylon sp. CI-4A]
MDCGYRLRGISYCVARAWREPNIIRIATTLTGTFDIITTWERGPYPDGLGSVCLFVHGLPFFRGTFCFCMITRSLHECLLPLGLWRWCFPVLPGIPHERVSFPSTFLVSSLGRETLGSFIVGRQFHDFPTSYIIETAYNAGVYIVQVIGDALTASLSDIRYLTMQRLTK